MALHIEQTIADEYAAPVSVYERFTVFVVAAPTGTPHLQISPDGTTWIDLGAFPAANYQTVTDVAQFARMHGATGGSYKIVGLYSHEAG